MTKDRKTKSPLVGRDNVRARCDPVNLLLPASRAGSVRRRAAGSVEQGLIEVEVWNGLRIGGIESGGLIERELALGWCAGGTQWRAARNQSSWALSRVARP